MNYRPRKAEFMKQKQYGIRYLLTMLLFSFTALQTGFVVAGAFGFNTGSGTKTTGTTPGSTTGTTTGGSPTGIGPSGFGFNTGTGSTTTGSTTSGTMVSSVTSTVVTGSTFQPTGGTFLSQLMSVQNQTIGLANAIEQLLVVYEGAQTVTASKVFSFSTAGQAPPPPSPLGDATVNIFDKKTFAQFTGYLNGTTTVSYLTLINQLWGLYGQQIQTLTTKGDKAGAQAIVQKAFSNSSFVLAVYQQLVAQIITFFKSRITSFSLATFGQSGANYFLTTEIPALDAIVAQIEATFDAHFSGGVDGFPAASGIAGVSAQVYQAVQQNYLAQTGTVCTNFTMTLAESLAKICSPSLAIGQPLTEVLGLAIGSSNLTMMLSCLQQFYTIAQSNLSLLSQQTPVPTFGTYENPTQALAALDSWMASFYVYMGLVGQNVVTAACKTSTALDYQNQIVQASTQPQNTFFASMSQVLPFLQSSYQTASQYYASELDSANALLYSQQASALSSGIASWNKAETFLSNSDFPNAIASYESAASFFKQGGNNALSYILSHRSDAAALSYYQMLLSSYTQYYQSDAVPNLLTQMTTPLSGTMTAQQASAWHSSYPYGFVQIFYYDAAENTTGLTPTFQGMAWLAGQAITVFSHMLNAYQTDTTSSGATIRQYLQQSLVVLQNFVQASEGMFYNNALAQTQSLTSMQASPSSMAADANLGSGTVRGVVEGSIQYVKINEYFSKVDAMLTQNGSVPSGLQLPFAGLFSGLPVSGFAQFSKVSEVYWSLINVDPCLALATQYPEYAQVVVSAALILLMHAQALCADPTFAQVFSSQYTAALSAKIKTIAGNSYGGSTGVSLLMAEGSSLQQNAKAALDFESAADCYCAAALAGNSSAQTSYFTVLDTYAQWYISSSSLDYADFYAAAVYYRAYLAQKAGWTCSYTPLAKMTTHLQNFIKAFQADLISFASTIQSGSYTQALAEIQKFVSLQDEINFLAVRQKREQQLFGTVGTDFIVTSTTMVTSAAGASGVLSQVPISLQSLTQTVMSCTFPLVASAVCPQFVDPLANLAQLYLAQGTTQLNQLKYNFTSGNYQAPLQSAYTVINQNFANAVEFFGKSDRQDLVLTVQQAITEAAAFAYYSSVLPSSKTTALLTQNTTSAPSFGSQFLASHEGIQTTQAAKGAGTFGFGPAAPKVGGSTIQSSSTGATTPTKMSGTSSSVGQAPSVSSSFTSAPSAGSSTSASDWLPEYLLRYSEQDLTVLAQQEKATAQLAKSPSAATTTGSVSTLSYQALLTQAQDLLGTNTTVSSSGSNLSLVTSLVIPLYQLFLTRNGYTSSFSTLPEEVTRYATQVTNLVTTGMPFSSAFSLFTEYELEQRTMSDGTQHLILITKNGPLQAVPRFQGEIQTALYYYTEYSQFYAYNPQAVQIDGTTFYQLADPTFANQATAFKGVLGAYLAQMKNYETVAQNIMVGAPSGINAVNSSFATYAPLYQSLASAYSWIFSALNGVQNVQQNEGIFWMTSNAFNALNLQYYKAYINNCSNFLVGSPVSTPYKKVLTDISSLATMAASYAVSPSDQAALLNAVGDAYRKSGDLMVLSPATAPAIGGYPSTAATNLPPSALDFTASYTALACTVPLAGSLQAPQSFILPWAPYAQSADFYLNAYQSYASGYQANPTGNGNIFINDPQYRLAWGNYVLSLLRAVVQRIALFGRNSTSVKTTQTSQGLQIVLGTNAQFKAIVQQGQTYGGSQAQQGFASLQGGAVASVNSATIENQYSLMKNLLLDSFIYCSAAEQATKNALTYFSGGSSDQATNLLGGIMKCGMAYYAPGMEVLIAQTGSGANQNTSVLALPNSEMSLSVLGTLNLNQFVYSNTFQAFMEYCLYGLIGSAQNVTNPYPSLASVENQLALNAFVSQIYGLLQTLYVQSFLPSGAQNDPVQIANDIQAAVQAEQQNMMVNPEAYVG